MSNFSLLIIILVNYNVQAPLQDRKSTHESENATNNVDTAFDEVFFFSMSNHYLQFQIISEIKTDNKGNFCFIPFPVCILWFRICFYISMKQFIVEALLFIKYILCIFYYNLLQLNIFSKINSQVTPVSAKMKNKENTFQCDLG